MVYHTKISGIDCQLFIGNVLTFFMRLQFRARDFGDMLTVFLEAEVQELIKIFSSFISDKISDFKTDLYYQNPDYLEWSYREGKLLD